MYHNVCSPYIMYGDYILKIKGSEYIDNVDWIKKVMTI